MSWDIGETVGAYRIVEQLGQGGMATVYKGYHAALDRYVAIKALHAAFHADPGFIARFQREARVVARLEHPQIVPVYDFAEHAGAPYLVMKFIEGETLKARLGRGPMAAGEVARCVDAIGAALQFAHSQGVLHRDIKPSNVMLARDGGIFLTDFGLARMVEAGESTLSTDALLGTPSYMSPEQARGTKVLDAGTDIYSFGVLVYELVVGRVPFSADTPYAVIHDHIYSPLPPPRLLNPQVPQALELVLVKALAKEREERYATVAEMVAALDAALLSAGAAAAIPIAPAPPAPADPAAETPASSSETHAATHPPAVRAAALPEAVSRPAIVTPAEMAAASALPLAGPTRARPLRAAGPAGPTPPLSAAGLAGIPPLGAGAAPAVAPSRGFQFQWWHALLLVIALSLCVVLALSGLRRVGQRASANATATVIAALPTEPATRAPSPAVTPTSGPAALTPTAPSGSAQDHFVKAERAFTAGLTDQALAELDLAVAVDPTDTAVLLRAGDMALAHQLLLPALQHFYGPAVLLEAASPDLRQGQLASHAALALYLVAGDTGAQSYLDEQAALYPDSGVLLAAQQRWRVFFASGDGVPGVLQTIDTGKSAGSLAALVLGDYHLARGQLAEATRQFTPLAEQRLANSQTPDWVIREARCELEKIRTQRAAAKLETACVDPLLLLTGK